jgi:hypothetical protein
VAGLVTIGATASNNGALDHVDFLVDGAVVGTDFGDPPRLTWDSRHVADGSHVLTARAVAISGTAATSAAVRVIVMNPPNEDAVPVAPGGASGDHWDAIGVYALLAAILVVGLLTACAFLLLRKRRAA